MIRQYGYRRNTDVNELQCLYGALDNHKIRVAGNKRFHADLLGQKAMTKKADDSTTLAMAIESLASSLRELGRGPFHQFKQDGTGAIEILATTIMDAAEKVSKSMDHLADAINHATGSKKDWKV